MAFVSIRINSHSVSRTPRDLTATTMRLNPTCPRRIRRYRAIAAMTAPRSLDAWVDPMPDLLHAPTPRIASEFARTGAKESPRVGRELAVVHARAQDFRPCLSANR